jgi:NAD(P)H-dependent FMN reductase
VNNYVVVVGSSRPNSNSRRLADIILELIKEVEPDSSPCVIDLADIRIPMWDEGFWIQTESWSKIWSPISNALAASTALIFVVPEWGGMIPPELKNLLLLCSSEEVGHKPALIVSLSVGRGGSYPIAEFRMFGTKNNRLLVIPEHLIFQNVEAFIDSEDRTSLYMYERLNWCLAILKNYSAFMIALRKESADLIYQEKFEHGM